MSIWGICGAAIICLVFVVSFGKMNPKIAISVSIGLCIMLFVASIDNIIPIVDYIKSLSQLSGNSVKHLTVLIKCTGIGCVCSFTSELCRNSGESAIASAVEFFGKTEIIILCLPTIKALLELATTN